MEQFMQHLQREMKNPNALAWRDGIIYLLTSSGELLEFRLS